MSDTVIEMTADAGRHLRIYLDAHHRGGSWSLKVLTPDRWVWCGATPTACVVRAYLAGIAAGRSLEYEDVMAAADE